MVSSQSEFRTRCLGYAVILKGKLYAPTNQRPVNVDVHTIANANEERSPRTDIVMGGTRIQPFIHDITITVLHKKKIHEFTVFFQNHIRLQQNRAVGAVVRKGKIWRGSILVMRKGQKAPFVNLRTSDTKLTNFVVARFLYFVVQCRHLRIPKFLSKATFHKR